MILGGAAFALYRPPAWTPPAQPVWRPALLAMEKDSARLEAFSDGVFSIAITLLILEITVPVLKSSGNRNLLEALVLLWPSFFAFVLSFFVVLLMWINHHELFRMVAGVDRAVLFANGMLLLVVTFVPFPTAMLARYINTPAANAAVAFYCGTFFVNSLSYNLLLESVARNRRQLRADISNQDVDRLRHTYHMGMVVYGVSILVAIWNAIAGLLITIALWLLWATLRYDSRRR